MFPPLIFVSKELDVIHFNYVMKTKDTKNSSYVRELMHVVFYTQAHLLL